MPGADHCSLCEIILIENDPVLNFVNKRVLQLVGFKGNIHLFSSGRDAIEFLQQNFARIDDSPKPNAKLLVFVDEDINDIDSQDLIDILEGQSSLISHQMVLVLMVSGENAKTANLTGRQRSDIDAIFKPLVGSSLKELIKRQSLLSFQCIEKTTSRKQTRSR